MKKYIEPEVEITEYLFTDIIASSVPSSEVTSGTEIGDIIPTDGGNEGGIPVGGGGGSGFFDDDDDDEIP